MKEKLFRETLQNIQKHMESICGKPFLEHNQVYRMVRDTLQKAETIEEPVVDESGNVGWADTVETEHQVPKWYAVEYAGFWNIQDSPFYDGKNMLDAEQVGAAAAKENAHTAANAPEAIDIIKMLCSLKHYKDTVGKDSVYLQEQPKAWDLANRFLNTLVKREV